MGQIQELEMSKFRNQFEGDADERPWRNEVSLTEYPRALNSFAGFFEICLSPKYFCVRPDEVSASRSRRRASHRALKTPKERHGENQRKVETREESRASAYIERLSSTNTKLITRTTTS